MAAQFTLDLPGARILDRSNDWGDNYPTGPLPATAIVFGKETSMEDTDRWIIENYQDGYRIFNKGSKNWATISTSGKQVLGTPMFIAEACKWWIKYSGDKQEFWIQVPKIGGAVWTIKAASSQGKNNVFLDTLDKNNAKQRVAFNVV